MSPKNNDLPKKDSSKSSLRRSSSGRKRSTTPNGYPVFMRKFHLPRVRIDARPVEQMARNKNIESVRILSYGPNSMIFVGLHPSSDKFISIKVLLKNEIEKLGGTLVKRCLPYEKLYKDGRISKVYEIFAGTTLFFILSDHHKKNLAQVLIDKKEPMSEDEAKEMFLQVVQALNHMHSKKVAHRNLKLENILLNENMEPIIADYCYSIVVENASNRERLWGSLMPYLSPEILAKVPYDPMIADVWSLGVCLFIVLDYTFPFVPDCSKLTPEMRPLKHWKRKTRKYKNLSDNVVKCLETMLEYDTNKRITTDSLLKSAWFS